ncbi:MAG: cadherin-like domain-containing protein, partial [Anaerolineales bacterium]|nr:cadherin-like domain-containing protein [Anaerolineales bacterium]
DDAGAVRRVLLLYRETAVSTWTAVELPLDPATGRAAAFLPPAGGPIEYVVQAVDASGNVALALDHGSPFTAVAPLSDSDPALPRALDVQQTAGAASVAEGDVVTLTLVIRNSGLGAIQAGQVVGTLGPAAEVAGAARLDPPAAGQVGVYPLLAYGLELAPGQVVTLTLPLRALDGPAQLTHQVAVSSRYVARPVKAGVALPVLNLPPVAAADVLTTTRDTPLLLPAPGVLGNDGDVPADVLAAALQTAPLHGVVQLQPDGGLVYTPDTGFAGVDSFVYAVSDEDGGVSTAVVTIHVVQTGYAVYLPVLLRGGTGSGRRR